MVRVASPGLDHDPGLPTEAVGVAAAGRRLGHGRPRPARAGRGAGGRPRARPGAHRRAGAPAGGRRPRCRWWSTATGSRALGGAAAAPRRRRAPAVLTPHDGEFARLAGRPRATTASPPPGSWPPPPARSCCSRGRPPWWPTPTGGSGCRRPATPAWPPPAPAMCCPADRRPAGPGPRPVRRRRGRRLAARPGRPPGPRRGLVASDVVDGLPAALRAGRHGRGPPAGASMATGGPDGRRGRADGAGLGRHRSGRHRAQRPHPAPSGGAGPVLRGRQGRRLRARRRRGRAAALEAGADWLAVAQVDEAAALREAGIDAPLLLLSEPRPDELDVAVAIGRPAHRLHPGAWPPSPRPCRPGGAPAGPSTSRSTPACAGWAPPRPTSCPLAKAIAELPRVELEGVSPTAVADEPDNPFNDQQIARFDAVLDELRAAGSSRRIVHAANSAGPAVLPAGPLRPGPLRHRRLRPPARAGAGRAGRPAAGAHAHHEVSFVKQVAAGEGSPTGTASARRRHRGRHGAHRLRRRCVPVAAPGRAGGADPRAAPPDVRRGHDGPAHGRLRCRAPTSRPATRSCCWARRATSAITPDEWAAKLGTISYEVVCAIGPRVERRYLTSPACGPAPRPGPA